jgi:hypothetical protein
MLVPYSGTLPSASMTAWWTATGLSPSARPLGDVALEQIESARAWAKEAPLKAV